MSQRRLLDQKLRDCQAGRTEAFAWLAEQYGPRLYAYFFRSTGAPQDAEDLVQELFVRVLAKIGAYRHQDRFEPWLFRIAANLVRDRGRRRTRRPEPLPLHTRTGEEVSLAANLPDDGPPPDATLAQAEEIDRVQAALATLPPLDREIILARYYGELSFKELAQQFDLPLGTALAKVHRGMKTLKRILDQA